MIYSAELQKQLALKTIYDKELVNRTEEEEISETIKSFFSGGSK